MQVGVDISPLSAKRTGVGTYVYELIHALTAMDSTIELLGYAAGLSGIDATLVPASMPFKERRVPMSLIHKAWKHLGLPKVETLIGKRVDIVHATNFLLPPIKSAKRILSVHDISFTTHPEWTNSAVVKPYADSMKRYCDDADGILVFSKFTKSELETYYNTDPGKIHVTPHGIRPEWCGFSSEQAKEVVRGFGIVDPYVLFVGTIEERKNIGALLDAFSTLKDLPHKLVMVGGMGWLSKPFEELVDAKGLRDRVVLPGYVPQESLSAFYKAADAFAFPSLYEGFGFPVLEAFSSGCPVITSNSTSLPEVGGDAAVYVEPSDAEALAQAIRTVVTDATLADDLRNKGRQRVRAFSWSRTAQMTTDVYRSVLH